MISCKRSFLRYFYFFVRALSCVFVLVSVCVCVVVVDSSSVAFVIVDIWRGDIPKERKRETNSEENDMFSKTGLWTDENSFHVSMPICTPLNIESIE